MTSRARWRWAVMALAGVLLTACSSGGGTAAGPSSEPSSAPATSTTAAPAPPPSAEPAAPVPAEHRALYDGLAANLDAYKSAVDAMPDHSGGAPPPVLATELLPANGNRLSQLLQPSTLPAVDLWLKQLQAIGIRGVTLGIKVPMLLPEFGPDGDAYLAFYAQVADNVRAHGMVLDVELGELFCGTVYAKCSFTFHGSRDQFVAATVAQARLVIDRVRPDDLTILAEPTTQAALAGVGGFDTPEGCRSYVHDVLDGVGDRKGTKVGAGAATWLDPSFNAAILAEPVDYLALHIYPVNANIAANLVKDTALAQGAGKPIVADEVGLYKTVGGGDAKPATAATTFRLDSFSFFEPLDVRFAQITSEWATKAGAAFVSPYWAGELFAYVDWTAQLDTAPYAKLSAALTGPVGEALQAGRPSGLGKAWATALPASHP